MNLPSRRWQAVGGYLRDLQLLATARLENPHSYLKFIHLNTLRKQKEAKTLIETGTFRGVTTARCARVFDNVVTIELNPQLAKEASQFLSSYSNVRVICGDAVESLGAVMHEPFVRDAVVFLDGHYSGPGTSHGVVPEPALDELRVLSEFTEKIVAIMIDDFRNFGEEAGFPTKSELLKAIEELFPTFAIRIQDDQVIVSAP